MNRPLLATTIVLSLAAAAPADTIHVATGESIQDAIQMASDGDRVLVAPGTYYETIDFLGKAIKIRGTGGAAVTVIDAGGLNDSVVTFRRDEGLESILQGFTITGGAGRDVSGFRYGGGIYIKLANPVIRDCSIIGNTADAGGGLAAISVSFGVIDRCRFESNRATAGGTYGGGGLYMQGCYSSVTDCIFRGNLADGAAKGGGVSLFLGRPELSNCLIFENEARHGGGIINHKSSPVITNCTVAANTAVSLGGGLRSLYESAQPVVMNSIFWGNTAAGAVSEVLDQSGAATTIGYSIVRGGWDGAGSGSLDADPHFVDLARGDVQLRAFSPAIDAADNTAVPGGTSTDLDGNPRHVDDPLTDDSGVPDDLNPPVDIGAFEFQASGCMTDLTSDGEVDLDDLLAVLFAWGPCPGCREDIDGDARVDLQDLLIVLHTWGPCGG
jgi:hypothetical protein